MSSTNRAVQSDLRIESILIQNFKCFKDPFILKLNPDINIIVGDNEAGKSTILEAVHLALTGTYEGRLIKNELSEYLFNREAVEEGIRKTKETRQLNIPEIRIEVCLNDSYPDFIGNDNIHKESKTGLYMRIRPNCGGWKKIDR